MESGSSSQPLLKKVDFTKEDDRISSLPDEIITHILSFLSTEDAVRTSLLSLRWEKMWALVPVLHFSPYERASHVGGGNLSVRYKNFIDRVLLLHNTSVLRFHLDCTQGIENSLNAWVSALLERDVREIDITTICELNVMLPRRLFSCKTLVSLKIEHLYFDFPSSVFLPSLKVLHIMLQSPSDDFFEKLLSPFPVLEELGIRVWRDPGKSLYNISSSILKKLFFQIYSRKSEINDVMVTVDAPALDFLEVDDDCCVHYNLKNSPSLSKARVDVIVIDHVNPAYGDSKLVDKLCLLLKAISNVKNLSLGSCAIDALGVDIEKEWPVFSNVIHLELDVEGLLFDNYSFSKWPIFPNVRNLILQINRDFGYRDLSNYLAFTPNLTYLVINMVLLNLREDEFNSRGQQVVPTCLRSCLKRIKVWNFEGSKNELKLIKYMLKNAQVLETLTVGLCKFGVLAFQGKVLSLPRVSKNSQVVFV